MPTGTVVSKSSHDSSAVARNITSHASKCRRPGRSTTNLFPAPPNPCPRSTPPPPTPPRSAKLTPQWLAKSTQHFANFREVRGSISEAMDSTSQSRPLRPSRPEPTRDSGRWGRSRGGRLVPAARRRAPAPPLAPTRPSLLLLSSCVSRRRVERGRRRGGAGSRQRHRRPPQQHCWRGGLGGGVGRRVVPRSTWRVGPWGTPCGQRGGRGRRGGGR